MVKADLKRIAKVAAKGRTYYYAWRGGPRLRGEPGSPEFLISYHEAIENHRMPDSSRFRSLVVLYKASADYARLAETTQKHWSPWLDRIAEYFGELRIAQFDRPEKNSSDHPPLAQSMVRQAPHSRLWNAGSISRALACG